MIISIYLAEWNRKRKVEILKKLKETFNSLKIFQYRIEVKEI